MQSDIERLLSVLDTKLDDTNFVEIDRMARAAIETLRESFGWMIVDHAQCMDLMAFMHKCEHDLSRDLLRLGVDDLHYDASARISGIYNRTQKMLVDHKRFTERKGILYGPLIEMFHESGMSTGPNIDPYVPRTALSSSLETVS